MKIDKFKKFKKVDELDITTVKEFISIMLDIYQYSDINEMYNFMSYIDENYVQRNIKGLMPLDIIKLGKEINNIFYKSQIHSILNYKNIKSIIDDFTLKIKENSNLEFEKEIEDSTDVFTLSLYIKTDKISIIECKDLFSELEILELSINSTPLKQDFKIITTDAGTLGYGGFGVKVIIKF